MRIFAQHGPRPIAGNDNARRRIAGGPFPASRLFANNAYEHARSEFLRDPCFDTSEVVIEAWKLFSRTVIGAEPSEIEIAAMRQRHAALMACRDATSIQPLNVRRPA